MITAAIFARDLKVELFEKSTQEELQDELQEWLDTRTEERVVGISFEADAGADPASYRAHVLYTE